MAVDVDSLQQNLLDEIAFRQDLDPVYKICKHLFDVLRQTRQRTGGDVDEVSSIDQAVNAEDSRRLSELRQLTKKVRMLEILIGQATTEAYEIRRAMKKPDEDGSNIAARLKRIENRLTTLEIE